MYDNTIKDRDPVQIQQTLICLLEYRQQLVNLKERTEFRQEQRFSKLPRKICSRHPDWYIGGCMNV